MNTLIFIISSGVPGFITYHHLNKTSAISTDDNYEKSMIITLLSFVSVLLFVFINSLIQWEANITQLLLNLNVISLTISLLLTVVLNYFLVKHGFITIISIYNSKLNELRADNQLVNTSSKDIYDTLFESTKNLVYIEIYHNKKLWEYGFLADYKVNLINGKPQINLYNKEARIDTEEDDIKSNIKGRKKHLIIEDDIVLDVFYLEK
ncbi:hypothetical protein [Salinicoccus roseus]|uniref:hypothetical protein n=1 Tax=Salinicoccus roseus TaxID=45670 RepID=UPI002301DAC0|nr:hypothetical protein [Salinicoccus roseus]